MLAGVLAPVDVDVVAPTGKPVTRERVRAQARRRRTMVPSAATAIARGRRGSGPRPPVSAVSEFARGREAVGRRLCERAHHGGVDDRGTASRTTRNGRRPLGHQLRDHRLRRCACHRRLAGKHLVGDRAQCVDVAPRVEVAFAGRLLGAHVLEVPSDSPVPVKRSPADLLSGERDAEVREQRLSVLEQDVLGLDVSMDHALAMREVQRAGDLPRDANASSTESSFSRVSRSRSDSPLHERHDVEERPSALPESYSGRMCG